MSSLWSDGHIVFWQKCEGEAGFDTIFTNEQLAAMVTQRVTTLEALAGISGIGEARMNKYAMHFITELNKLFTASRSIAGRDFYPVHNVYISQHHKTISSSNNRKMFETGQIPRFA